MTPFLLTRLSAAVYGILPLVNSCTSFLVLASGGIQASVGRYFTYHLYQKNTDTANKYVNTAFFLMLLILGIALLPLLLIAFFFPTLFNIPKGYETQSRIVMFLLGSTLYVDMLSNPFSIGFYATQRFDLRAIIFGFRQLLQAVLVVVLFLLISNNIVIVAGSTFFTTLISCSLMLYISKRLVPSLRCSFTLFDKSKLPDIASYSIWTLVGQVAWLLILNTDYMIINKFLGPGAVTDYSLAARWNETLRSIITAAVAVIMPLATSLQAKGLLTEVRELVTRSLRIVIIILMAPCLLLCLFSRELLLVWVGQNFTHVSLLFWPCVFPLIWILIELPLRYILNALGIVKWPALGGLFAALLNLVMSISFVTAFKMGAFGVALATSISFTLYSLAFLPYYTFRKINIKTRDILVHFGYPTIASVPMILLALSVKRLIHIQSWLSLCVAVGTCVAVYACTAFYVALTPRERRQISLAIMSFPLVKKLCAVLQ
jgi:membrane protein EpsK